MNNMILKGSLVVVLVLFSGCTASSLNTGNKSVKNTKSISKSGTPSGTPMQNIKKMKVFDRESITVKEIVDRGELFQVKLSAVSGYGRTQTFDAYVTKNYELAVIGKGFGSDGKELVIPVDMSVYKSQAAFTYGHGPKEYFVFTDPECPYCKRFEDGLERSATVKENATLYFFFYPLPNHRNAADISMYAMSVEGNDAKFKAMTSDDWKNKPLSDAQKQKYSKVLESHKDIANTLGLKGTPSVFDAQGSFVSWPSVLR